MNEPKLWLKDGAPPVVGHALRAAASEQPPSGALERALASVMLGAGAAGVATKAAGAVGPAAASGVFLKWTLVGLAVTLGTVGAGLGIPGLREEGPAQSPARVGASTAVGSAVGRSTRPVTAAPAVEDEPPPRTEKPAPRRRAGEPPRDPDAPSKAPVTPDVPIDDVDLLAQETAFIERARAQSAAGRAAVALGTLDEYEVRFPARRYGPEALYLRMEALIALGQHSAAQQVAARLATSYPNSPHAARAEAVRKANIP